MLVFMMNKTNELKFDMSYFNLINIITKMNIDDKCSNCNKLNKINYPFSLEAVECERLLFC